MMETERYLDLVDDPDVVDVETLEAADLPPPEPLTKTLEVLSKMSEDTALVQYNDRRPRHLYPKLEERGYEYETRSDEEEDVVTVIWKPR